VNGARAWRGPRAPWLVVLVASLTVVALVTLTLYARGHRATRADRGARVVAEAEHRGDLLRYLPNDCAAYRVYVDIAALVPALHLDDVLTSARVPGPWKGVFTTFESAHLRLGREIQELAVCAQEVSRDDDETSKVYVAIGGRLGGQEALHAYRAVVRELTHAKDSEVLEKESGGVPYLVTSYAPQRKWIAMPGPDVLVFYTDAVAQIATIAKPHEVDRARWRLGDGVVSGFAWSSQDDDDPAASDTTGGTLSLAPSDSGGDPTLVLDAAGSLSTTAPLDPARMETIPGKLADAIAASPFVGLADPVRRMRLDLRGRKLRLGLDVPVAKLVEAGQIAARDRRAVRDLWVDLRRAVASPGR
jgi:hypothetical protein